MTEKVDSLTARPAWKALTAHAATIKSTTLRDLFQQDPSRGTIHNVEACGIFLDFSKNRATTETFKLLFELAEQSGIAVMPAYTHLQRAEPVLIAHWLLAYVAMLERDISRFVDLGAASICALSAGSPEACRAMWFTVLRTLTDPSGSCSCETICTFAVKGALGTGVTKIPGIWTSTPRYIGGSGCSGESAVPPRGGRDGDCPRAEPNVNKSNPETIARPAAIILILRGRE